MAKKTATTPHNTGLSIKRSGNKFTASWKIKTKEPKSQKLRYRTYNGKKWSGWTTKTLGAKSTSYSFTLAATSKIKKIHVETKINRNDTDKTNYEPSLWASSSATYKVEKPPAPTLSVSNVNANRTTFSWSIDRSDTNRHWYDRCYYRTKCTTTPDADKDWSAWTHAGTSSYTYTDTTPGTTRIFQIKARGPAGYSAVKTQRHIIGTAPIATWRKPEVSLTNLSSYYKMTYAVSINGSSYNVDKVTPQYFIGTPTVSMGCPSGSSFTDGAEYGYDGRKKDYTLSITTSDTVGLDECLWARVKTTHDSIDSFSSAYRVITGKLTAPSCTISMGTPTASGFTVSVTIDDVGTDVPGAYAQVYLVKRSAPGQHILIGSLANGQTTKTITSTLDITAETGYSIKVRNVSADGKTMISDYYTYSTSMPSAPTLDDVSPTTASGKVFVEWTNNWGAATGTVIAWTDDPDNWMSNEEPETYEVTEKASAWYITGLETGKTWYFRTRSVQVQGESETYSAWSNEIAIDLAAAPAVPVLYLSDEAITEDGMVTAYWSYVSTDGTSQVAATIVEATRSGDTWTYGEAVVSTTTAQHIDLFASELGWTNGTVKYLALQTRSGSGGQSEYSTPVQIAIAAKPAVTITAAGFDGTESVTETFEADGTTDRFICAHSMTTAPSVTVDGASAGVASYTDGTVVLTTVPGDGSAVVITYTTTDNPILTVLPLTATVATANAAELTIAIERATAYPMLRPDGTETDGADGETVYVETVAADATNTISVALTDLIGRLDDGAYYNLVATVRDNYGQTAEDIKSFKVHWAHQAWMPTATFITDETNYIARITPVADGDHYESGDTCDIYRMGADKPELIYSGAAFATEYVDPYPAFGEFSGYKIVTVTQNGDYITDDNGFSEYDTVEAEDEAYTQLDPQTIVIDFGGNRVELPYNITLDNTWSKDFERTQYLGGSVVGDLNKAVTRDLSAGTVLVKEINEEFAVKMRALARYAKLCHVRTPEGSSFAADVQVKESRGYDSATMDYELTIKKVDNVGYDAMTYAEWMAMQ